MPLEALDLPLLLVIAGIVLLVGEAMVPGAHFIVLGVALLTAGLIGLTFGPLASPLALAAMVLAAGAGALYVYREFDLYGGTESGQTSNSASLTGKTGHVTERVTRSEGQVKLDQGGFNPYYQARSVDGDIPEGEEVIVIDPGGGNVLTVDSFDHLDRDEIDRELARERAASETTSSDGSESQTRTDADLDDSDGKDRERDVEAEEAG